MPTTSVTQIFRSGSEAEAAAKSSFSQARTVVRQIPQSATEALEQTPADIARGGDTFGDLAIAARTSAEQAIAGREDAPRYNDIDRVSNPGRGHQYSLNQGGIVTANTAGDVVGSAALGNSIPLNTSEVLMNPDEGSAIWQVVRVC